MDDIVARHKKLWTRNFTDKILVKINIDDLYTVDFYKFKGKRKIFAKEHNVAEEYQFNSLEQLLDQEKLADVIIITIPGNMHIELAIRAKEKGYKILLEKPVAPNLEGTLKRVIL